MDRLKSTLNLRNEIWANHIESLGGLEKAIEYFKNQQEAMVAINTKLSKYVKTSLIEVYNVNNISTNSIFNE